MFTVKKIEKGIRRQIPVSLIMGCWNTSKSVGHDTITGGEAFASNKIGQSPYLVKQDADGVKLLHLIREGVGAGLSPRFRPGF